MIVSRTYLYHPELVKAIFTLGTPYLPPDREWLDFDAMTVDKPTFEYQRHFGSPEFESYLQSKESIHESFNATFGGRGPNNELGFSIKGPLVHNWKILREGTQISEKVANSVRSFMLAVLLRSLCVKEINYYVDQYSRNGLHGPRRFFSLPTPAIWLVFSTNSFLVNWYRNRRQNYEDERLYVQSQ